MTIQQIVPLENRMKKNEFAELINEWKLLLEGPDEPKDQKKEEKPAETAEPSAELGPEDEPTEEVEQSDGSCDDTNAGDDTETGDGAPENIEEDIEEDVKDVEEFQNDAAELEGTLTGIFKDLNDIWEENPELKERYEKAGTGVKSAFKSLNGLFEKIVQFCADNKEKKPELAQEISDTTSANLESMAKVNQLAEDLLEEIKGEGDTKETAEALVATTEELLGVFEKVYTVVKKSPTEKIDPKSLTENLSIMLTTQKILKENF